MPSWVALEAKLAGLLISPAHFYLRMRIIARCRAED